MTPSVTIESYLTEQKLAVALQELTGPSWTGGQVSLPGSRRRFDMAYTRGDVQVLVEFDGDAHYRDALKIKHDLEKAVLAARAGMQLVRVPYWVQLDGEMVRRWFDIDAEVKQSFPHGFISTKLFPASFCELGVARFVRELETLPDSVRRAVIRSLQDRATEHGISAPMITYGGVAQANGVTYVGTTSGTIFALDSATGAVLWSDDLPDAIAGSPTVANGVLYVPWGYQWTLRQGVPGTAGLVAYGL